MLVVTGSPRTGTSAMMQTLKLLGIPPISPAFTKEHTKIRNYNRKGFYEPDMEQVMKLKDVEGMAVKLFGSALPFVKKDIVNKMIVMKRDKQSANKSYTPVMEELGEGIDVDFVYDVCYTEIEKLKGDTSYLEVNFEDLIQDPEKEIDRIVEFLQLSGEGKDQAIKNIDTWQ